LLLSCLVDVRESISFFEINDCVLGMGCVSTKKNKGKLLLANSHKTTLDQFSPDT
jgi:hypothetical protein